MVRYLNGIYFIEDRSTNGMLLNGAPLIKGEPSALTDGDRLLIDTFEVEVHLRDAGAAAPAPDLLMPEHRPPRLSPSTHWISGCPRRRRRCRHSRRRHHSG
ncbi:hypothetical protein RLIN73S_02204 [Rhodanobacter lindaniclasticus]